MNAYQKLCQDFRNVPYGSTRKAFFARRAKLPVEVVQEEAVRSVQQEYRRAKQPTPEKLTIRVFRAQGKRLLVLRVGDRFVSSFTWDTLMRKAAFGPWKRIDETTLGMRWK